MNILKTPNYMIKEDAGLVPASPGMLKTPQQLLLEESGVMPRLFAKGGEVNSMSPEDMLAMIIAMGQTPQKFANGGGVLGTNYQPTYNPEATLEPQDRSSYTLRTRDKLAEILARMSNNEAWAEKTADQLFGTGSSEGLEPWSGANIPTNVARMGVQMFNPVSVATSVMDAPKQAMEATREEGPIAGGLELSMAGLGALPYVGPSLRGVKKLGSKISKKIKK
jgi:hypothetical protein